MKSVIRKDEAAVSPVIATILMVAITVVLAAVLYVMVSGLISPVSGNKPLVTFSSVTQSSGNATIGDRKSTRLNSSHGYIPYAVFCLKKQSSIILIMAPILFPTAMRLGIDPVHFGILIDVNMEVGLCHPPVGLNLYVASGISGLGITELTKAVMPWLLTMLVFLVIVTYWPELTLYLPRVMGML